MVEDANINGHPVPPDFGPGRVEAVKRFLSTGDEFMVGRRCERFLVTLHPGGYLRRIEAHGRPSP